MMDGVSTMDTGSNRPLLQLNIESIAEVKVLTSGYQAEYGRASGLQITAVTKSGTNRFRGSVYDVERNSDWNANSWQNMLNGNPKTISKQRDWASRSAGRSASPAATTSCSSSSARNSHRAPAATTSASTACRPRSSAPATSRRRPTTTASRIPTFGSARSTGACTATDQRRASGRRRARQDSGEQALPDGLNILKMYPLPNHDNVRRAGLTTTRCTRPAESSQLAAGRPPRLPADTVAARHVQVLRRGEQREQTFPARCPASTTRRCTIRSSRAGRVGQLQLEPDDVPRGDVRPQLNQLAGCVGTAAAPDRRSARRAPGEPADNRSQRGSRRTCRSCSRTRRHGSRLLRVRGAQRAPAADLGRHAHAAAADVHLGGRVANAPPNLGYPGWFNINPLGHLGQPDQGARPPHVQGGLLQHPQLQGSRRAAARSGTINFSQDNPEQSVRHVVRLRQRRDRAASARIQQASKYVEGIRLQQHRGLHPGQLEGERRLTLDYGLRFVHQQPQYDTLGRRRTSCRTSGDRQPGPGARTSPGCANGVVSVPGTNRQAKDPRRASSSVRTRRSRSAPLMPDSGNPTNGLYHVRPGHCEDDLQVAALGLAPRFGMAYDMSGEQKIRVARRRRPLLRSAERQLRLRAACSNPPTSRSVTVRYGAAPEPRQRRPLDQAPPSLTSYEYDSKLPTSTQWNGGVQMTLPWSSSLDVEYVGQHSYNRSRRRTSTRSTWAPRSWRRTRTRRWRQHHAGRDAVPRRPDARDPRLRQDQLRIAARLADVPLDPALVPAPLPERHLVRLQRHDRALRQAARCAPPARPGRPLQLRDDQAQADELLGHDNPQAHIMKANFVWDLPDLRQRPRAEDDRLRDQRLAVLRDLDRVDGRGVHGGLQLPERRRQRQPDRLARLRRPRAHRRRSGRGLQQRHVPAVQHVGVPGPLVGSVGLESGNSYLQWLLHERARPRDRTEHPARRRPRASSCASTCSTHRIRPASPAATRR